MRVKPIHHVPTFEVNGSPFLTPAFETYIPKENYFRQFAEAGTQLFSFNTNAAACDYGHSLPAWVEVDVWDYTQFDQLMDSILRVKPDAMVMPRVNMGTPRWWLDAHPEELERFEDGGAMYDPARIGVTLPKDRPFPSIASEVWREDMSEALRRLLKHVEEKGYLDHIFGYMIVGMHTEEWYHWSAGSQECLGYSAPTVSAFRQWLQNKYGSDDALRQAWHAPAATIATAQPPSCAARKDEGSGTFRDPTTAMPVIDFLCFWNELIPDTISYFAAEVKGQQPGKAVGGFYGYMYEFDGNPEFGHSALGEYLRSPHLDFMLVTASYFNRQLPTGADYPRSAFSSVALHGKVWYHDNDTISYLGPKMHGLDQPGRENDPWWGQLRLLGLTNTPEETISIYRRGMGFVFSHGFYGSFFDLHGGYFDSPPLMEEVGRLNRLAQQSATSNRSSAAEILAVSDEDSCAYVTHRNPLLTHALRSPQVALCQIGAPVDHVLLEDLREMDLRRYKLVVFLNCFNVSSEERRVITRKLKRDGKWLVWCHAAGLFNGNKRSEAEMQELTSLPVALEDGTSGLRSTLPSGEVIGPETPSVQGTVLKGEGFETLGVLASNGSSAIGKRHHDGWTAVSMPTPDVPASLYRKLAREAGVHIYNGHDDTLYANQDFICVSALDDGPRTIRLPESGTWQDAITRETICEEASEFTFEMKAGETRLLMRRNGRE